MLAYSKIYNFLKFNLEKTTVWDKGMKIVKKIYTFILFIILLIILYYYIYFIIYISWNKNI